jgi:hypothetical protein
MTENIDRIIKCLNITLDETSNPYKTLLTFDELGLLNSKTLEINPSLWTCIEHVCKEDYLNVILSLSIAVPDEFEIMACLAFEGFSPWGDMEISLIENEKIDIAKTKEVFTNKYAQYINFGIFRFIHLYNFKEQAYEAANLPRLLLQILNNHCGNSEQSLQDLFGKEFQNYLNCLGSFMLFINNKDSLKLISAFNKYYNLDLPFESFQKDSEFNNYFARKADKFLDLTQQLAKQFAFQRKLTLSVIESHLNPIINKDFVNYGKTKTPSLLTFEEFNLILSDLYSKTEQNLSADIKKKLCDYIKKDYSTLNTDGGFINVIVNQHNLIVKCNKLQKGEHELKLINEATEKELTLASEQYSITLDNIAVIDRLKFIVSNIENVTDSDEKTELWEKLACIVSSKSITFYSDIFELYVYTVLKSKGVPIKLIKSQVKSGNKVSTCDYKIGDDFAADCKCIISNNADLHQISEHSSKIGKQIKSTIGYENITFGGGIIGYRDRNFEFLKPFSNYNGDEKSKQLILNFILDSYSEFRRHTEVESQEKIKFLLIYYLPNSNIKPEDIKNATYETVEEKNEIFFLLTTKYATPDEIKKITEAFKTVTPMIFQFTNYFSN